MNEWLLVPGDLLLLSGLVVLTLGLVGVWRFEDFFSRLHAAAKVGSLGLAALLAGTITTGDLALVLRALLIAVFLVVTAPVTTHALARSAERRRREGEAAAGGGRTPQAARTESTGGRRRAAVRQVAPASAEANSSPEVAPK